MPSRAGRRTRMAYREVRMMDIDQVMRRWLAGERIRAVARSTGLDRNTVRRLIRVGQQVGLKLGAAWPDEAKLQSIRERLSRPGAAREQGPIEQALLQRQSQIQAWLKDQLILTKIHELLGREGFAVPYPTLHRFARKYCGFGKPAGTVRRIEGTPGEFAEVDFGQLGLMQELGSGRRRVVHGFMMVLGYSHDPAQGTVRCLDQRRLSALFRLGRRAWERAGLKSIYHTGSRLQIRDTSNTFKGRYKQRLNKPTIKSSREVRN